MKMLAVVGVLVLLLVLRLRFESSLPKKYQSRKCEGGKWRRAFPHATKHDIRTFLLLFTAAFALRDSDKLKFSPNDRVWEIYRDLYPNRWVADALELETLTDELSVRHGIVLGEIWSEKLTLGEVFDRVQRDHIQVALRASTLRFESTAACRDSR
jgi:propanediol dehydratase small subunit